MRFLAGKENEEAAGRMREAAKMAGKSLCLRSKCGAVIVKNKKIIGVGYNAPPLDDIANRTCWYEYPELPKKIKFDRTCCMHAEWRAILDALKWNPNKIPGSRLYFVRVDGGGNIEKSGKPYCTVCSRFALDVGISEFVLWHEEGICVYLTGEYNTLSYEYFLS